MEDKISFASHVYDRIKNDIIELRLEPGAYFLTQEIAETLGASRTPVREAVKRLEQDGWIVWESYRKARVKEITLEGARDVFQARKMIEPFCLNWLFEQGLTRLVAGKLDVIVSEMESHHDNWVQFMYADLAFHSAIVNEVGNGAVSKFWGFLSDEITRVGIYSRSGPRKTADVVREHREMLQALWDVDKERVMEKLLSHYDGIFNSLRNKLQGPQSGHGTGLPVR